LEEAIRSSQLEGAATTRPVAKEMIRSGRRPKDRSEQMILNNFRTMQHIHQLKDEALTPDRVFELHRMVTEDALDDPSAAGRLRHADEKVHITDFYNEVFHVPPPAGQLEGRLAVMCDFANMKIPEGFIHPVIRSIILHFWLAYDHPFTDGNGRCARALFYWSMLKYKYWLCEFISISHIIYRAPMKYYRAFLYTETDENDLTYFVLHHLDIIRAAIHELHLYLERKTKEIKEAEQHLKGFCHLNHRQRALISHALRHPDARYTFRSHRLSHNVVYETARTDLLDLAEKGLLEMGKMGRTRHFRPVKELQKALADLT
jgi:Fic family protein